MEAGSGLSEVDLHEGVPCGRSLCPGQGTWIPVMVFRPTGERKEVKASLPSVKICEMHRGQSTLDTFLSPEGFTKIERFLRENGKGNFQRRAVRLEWKKNNEEDLLAF